MSILHKTLSSSPLQLSLGHPPRRRIDRETTPGHCRNLDYCSIGMQRALIRVPVSQGFVCPECGGPLFAPVSRFRVTSGVLPTLRIAVLLTGMTLAFSAGYGVAQVQPAVSRAVVQASRSAVQAAQTAMHPPAKPKTPLSRTSEVTLRPYPARTGPVDVVSPPIHLLHEARLGQVTIDCTLVNAAARPTCRTAEIRGTDAFSADAAAWLQSRAVQYVPAANPSKAAAQDHRWRVVFQDFGGTQRQDAP